MGQQAAKGTTAAVAAVEHWADGLDALHARVGQLFMTLRVPDTLSLNLLPSRRTHLASRSLPARHAPSGISPARPAQHLATRHPAGSRCIGLRHRTG
jgi:hypothetical protein